jgi:hypothetical protein
MIGYGRIAKKVLASSCILFTLLLLMAVGTHIVNAVTYPTQPVKIPPIITVNSPQGTYTTSDVTLNFTVKAPGDWYKDGAPLVFFRNATYQVDSHEPVLIWTTGQTYSNITPGELTGNISGLSKSSHTILIVVIIGSVYDVFGTGDPHGHFAKEDIWNSTKTILFNVDATPSSSDTPTPNPTSSPSIPELPIAAAISVIAVASIALVFFKRRKSKKA